MDREWMRQTLPQEAPTGLLGWVEQTCPEELGGDWLIFQGERIPVSPSLSDVLEQGSMAPKYKWAARCTCTACEDTFHTTKTEGLSAVRFGVGEDEMLYPILPGEWREHVIDVFSGEQMQCPFCLNTVTVLHGSSIHGGRTKRLMVQTLQNVEGFTTVFYWMAVRLIDENGYCSSWMEPMEAYVLTEKGSLERYTHVRRTTFGTYRQLPEWIIAGKCEDKHDAVYPDWGSICNKKSGTVFYGDYPELEGTTGEKTGLEAFTACGGTALVQYLKFWQKHRNIENLVKAGQARLVVDIMQQAWQYSYALKAEMEKYIDLQEKKPNRMLGLTREEFRELRRQDRCLRLEELEEYQRYRGKGGKLGLFRFLGMLAKFGRGGIHAALEIMAQTPGTDLDKIARYMEKQGLRPDEVQLLVDTRKFAKKVSAPQPLTQEELWPRRLMATHERLNQILEERRRMADRERNAVLDRKFTEVVDRFGALQWTDGDLCILLPKCSGELHEEGRVLRHCVGGYTERHISGSDTIFFVRHYRRPERSYYTLDIRMDGDIPKEIQLHGYGNERHGTHKQYSHRIPGKVRAFVDRWKQEILVPWWAANIRQEETA